MKGMILTVLLSVLGAIVLGREMMDRVIGWAIVTMIVAFGYIMSDVAVRMVLNAIEDRRDRKVAARRSEGRQQ